MNVTPATVRLLLKPNEAAQALALSPRKLWAMTASGEIACVRCGRSGIFTDPLDLRLFIEKQKKGGST